MEIHDIDVESYRDGWRKTIAEAIAAAMSTVPYDDPRVVELLVQKKNPIHEYKVVLRPPG